MFKRQGNPMAWHRLNPPGLCARLRHLIFGRPRVADKNMFVETASSEIVNEIAAPIIGLNLKTNEVYMCGMATIIGPGYAITAAHVLEEFNSRFGTDLVQNEMHAEYVLLVFLSVNQGAWFIPLKVTKSWIGVLTDIAILYFEIPIDWPIESHRWKRPSIQLMAPQVGERISAFGFAGPGGSITGDGKWTFDLKPISSTGRVAKIHHDQRDAVRMPFPCFRVDARFDGNMSGGPVFNSSGNLCGIICSSFPAIDDNDEHASYVATLWPLLAYRVDSPLTKAYFDGACFAYELFERGLFVAVDRDQIQVTHVQGQTPQLRVWVPGEPPEHYRE